MSASALLASAGISGNITGFSQLQDILDLSPEELSKMLNTAAHELGLHDFYTAHVTTWCDGTLMSNDGNTTTNSSDATEQVTYCTDPTFPFWFDPVKILEDELLQGLTLSQIGFPTTEIDTVVNALEKAYKAMNICYLLGTLLCGLSLLTGILGLLASRAVEAINEFVAMLAFLALGVASGIATAIAIKVRDVINEKASFLNIVATSSSTFLGMSWAATVGMLCVMLMWCCVCCCGTHGRRWKSDEWSEKMGQRWTTFGRRK
jgi:hypothetical protein